MTGKSENVSFSLSFLKFLESIGHQVFTGQLELKGYHPQAPTVSGSQIQPESTGSDRIQLVCGSRCALLGATNAPDRIVNIGFLNMSLREF